MSRYTIGVDASFIARDRRGMGRCIRSILAAWEGKTAHRIVLLCHARRHLGGLDPYVEAGWEVALHEKTPPLDVCWFPWNRVDWNPKCPAVVHIHDVAPFTQFHLQNVEQDRERLIAAVAGADRVLTDSNFSRTEIHRHLEVDWDHMEVIPLAKDELFVPQEPVPSKANPEVLARVGDKPFLLYVGNLEPRKNLLGLLEAFMLLARPGRPQLVLVCPKPTSTWTERLRGRTCPILELAKTMEEKLVWLEDIADETLAQLYRDCRLFVMPSLYEGFGLPLLEAMACGAPTAAARAASLPEVGGDVPMWFNPHEPVDIARVIMEALAVPRPSPQAALAQAAHFSWENTAGQIMAALEEAAGRAVRARTA